MKSREPFFAKLAEKVLRHRAFVLAVLIGLVAGSVAGASKLTPNFSLRAFFGQHDPAQDILEEYREFWGADDSFVLILVSADGSTLVTPERFRALDETHELLKESPSVESIRSATRVALIEGQEESEINLEGALDSMPEIQDSQEWKEWKAMVMTNPFVMPTLLSKDGTTAALVVELTGNSDDATEIVGLVDDLRMRLDRREGVAGLSYITAGVPAVRRDFFYSFFRDIRVFGGIGLVMAIFLLGLIFRSFYGVVIPILAAGLPVLMVFGVMGFMGKSIGVLNQAFVTLLPAIAIADAIHLISRYREELQKAPSNATQDHRKRRQEAIRKALTHIGLTCLLTSVTTAVGFLSLQVASMPILHEFGTYAALGMLFGYVTVLLVVPTALSYMGTGAPSSSQAQAVHFKSDRFLRAMATFSTTHSWRVLAITGAILVLFLYFSTQVTLDNRLTSLLRETHPTSQANEKVDAELGGVLTLELDVQVIDSGDETQTVVSLADPRLMQPFYALESELLKKPALRVAVSPATYVASAHKMMMGTHEIPDSKAAIEQLIFFMEGSDAIENLLSADRRRGRLILRVQDVGGIQFDRLGLEVEHIAKKAFEGLPVQVNLTGTAYIAYRGINRITTDLRNSLTLAFLVIAVIIGLLFQNFRIALICLVPNALPLLAGYALMGAMGWLLQPSSALVFTVALGIAVDDTIHMMARYREGLQEGMSNDEAIHHAVLRCGHAVAITSLVLCLGFGVNMLSEFQQMSVLGALGTTVIFTALLCDVFVLPALLHLAGESKKPQNA